MSGWHGALQSHSPCVLLSGALASLLLTALVGVLFFLIRKLLLDLRVAWTTRGTGSSLYISFGTELYALLLAADLSVALGLFDIARLYDRPLSTTSYSLIACVLGAWTMAACVQGLSIDRRMVELSFWRRTHGSPSLSGAPPKAGEFGRLWLHGTMLRWLLASVHLMFIIKLPRWDWLARYLLWPC